MTRNDADKTETTETTENTVKADKVVELNPEETQQVVGGKGVSHPAKRERM